jgi:hypothetical protein
MRQDVVMGERPTVGGTAGGLAAKTLELVWSPFFMLRVGGVPADSVLPLRCPETVAWTRRVLDSERALRLGRDALADDLEQAVSQLTDDAVRRTLLMVRRDVFNLRLPKRAGDLNTLVSCLDPAVGSALVDWVTARRRHQELLAEGDRLLAKETVAGRRHLQQLVNHPHIRKGLLLASHTLDTYLPTYLREQGADLGKRSRRIERSVLEYVYRTACKTSPFSTLTGVALGRFDQAADSLLDLGVPDDEWRSHTRLNLAVISRIVALIQSDPGRMGDLPVRVTPGWREDRDRIRYVRRQQLTGADDTTVTMDMVRENLFYLSSTQVLEEVFDILPEGSQLRLADLAERLTRHAGDERYRDQVDDYLGHLVRLGLLVAPTLHINIHDPDPLRRFSADVRALDTPWASRLAARLDTVAGEVDEYRTASVDQRRRLLESIRLELAEAQYELGADESTIPRTLIYEDVNLTGTRPIASARDWDEQLKPALAGLMRILPVFDLTLPQRLFTRGFFRARYGDGGRCDDVVRFVHEFHQDFYEQYLRSAMRRREFDDNGEYVPQPNWLNLPEIEALDRARAAVVDEMRRRYAAHEGDDVPLELDDDFVERIAAELPDPVGDIDPHCFFLQVGRDPEPFAVLNRAYSGLTLQFSRFAHCFPDAEGHGLTDGLRSTLADVCPPGAVFAELKGGYETTNLNLHPAVTPYELVCPGDISFRPAAEQIFVDDLYIEDDPVGGRLRLRSSRLGVEVIPVYLGFLVPLALPEMQRLLMNFSYTSMARIDLWSGVDQPLRDKPVGGHPRVRYRDLVLTRRLWKTHPSRLPQRGPEQTEAEHVLDWARWKTQHGLPNQVFVTPDVALAEEANADPGGKPAFATTLKPQYVDFESVFSLSLLDNIVKSATSRLVFTEMLPDLSQAWLRPGGSTYVSELTVELDGVRRAAS